MNPLEIPISLPDSVRSILRTLTNPVERRIVRILAFKCTNIPEMATDLFEYAVEEIEALLKN